MSTATSPTKAQLLSGGGADAAKFRDHVGETWYVRSCREISTANGPATLFDAAESDDASATVTTFWSPSVVTGQLKGLADHGYLPGFYRFEEATSATGRRYFTLRDPDAAPTVGGDELPDELVG